MADVRLRPLRPPAPRSASAYPMIVFTPSPGVSPCPPRCFADRLQTVSVLFLLCVANSVAYAQTQAGATIRGQVSNAATGSYLNGAVVLVTGTQQSVITDREG